MIELSTYPPGRHLDPYSLTITDFLFAWTLNESRVLWSLSHTSNLIGRLITKAGPTFKPQVSGPHLPIQIKTAVADSLVTVPVIATELGHNALGAWTCSVYRKVGRYPAHRDDLWMEVRFST